MRWTCRVRSPIPRFKGTCIFDETIALVRAGTPSRRNCPPTDRSPAQLAGIFKDPRLAFTVGFIDGVSPRGSPRLRDPAFDMAKSYRAATPLAGHATIAHGAPQADRLRAATAGGPTPA